MGSRTSAMLRAAQALVSEARGQAPLPQLESSTRALYPLTRAATLQERSELLDVLAPALGVPEHERALLVGQLCGALLEDGLSHGDVERALVQRYLALASGARRFHDAVEQLKAEDRGAGPSRAKLALELSAEHAAHALLARAPGPGVAALSASKSARSLGRPLAALLAPLSEVLPAARSLSALASVLDDAPYLAVEPATGRAMRGVLSGASTNAQLHVLLMDHFPLAPGQGPRVTAEVAANARGVGPASLHEVVVGAFTLHDYRALGTAGLSSEESYILWNEGRPEDIPSFEGQLMVLLGEPRYPRSWRAQREYAGMRAELTVEAVLEQSEVAAILQRLMAANST